MLVVAAIVDIGTCVDEQLGRLGPLAKKPGQSVTTWSGVRPPAAPPRREDARPGCSSTSCRRVPRSPVWTAATTALATSGDVIGVPSFFCGAHAQVVPSTLRHPTKKRRPRTFAPTIGLTPALEPRYALHLCDPGKKCHTEVQPDDHKEDLAHFASLLRCRRSATTVIIRGCLTLTRPDRM